MVEEAARFDSTKSSSEPLNDFGMAEDSIIYNSSLILHNEDPASTRQWPELTELPKTTNDILTQSKPSCSSNVDIHLGKLFFRYFDFIFRIVSSSSINKVFEINVLSSLLRKIAVGDKKVLNRLIQLVLPKN